jgi:hypothetical protein
LLKTDKIVDYFWATLAQLPPATELREFPEDLKAATNEPPRRRGRLSPLLYSDVI